MKLQVGVKALIQNSDGQYLFIRRSAAFENEAEPHWDIPGGRINPDERLAVALQREINEETGLKVTNEPSLIAAQDIVVEAIDLHVVRLTYRVNASGSVVLSDEHQEMTWATKTEALKMNLDPYLLEVLSAAG